MSLLSSCPLVYSEDLISPTPPVACSAVSSPHEAWGSSDSGEGLGLTPKQSLMQRDAWGPRGFRWGTHQTLLRISWEGSQEIGVYTKGSDKRKEAKGKQGKSESLCSLFLSSVFIFVF